MKKRRLSVILPTYNEADNIQKLITAINKICRPLEIIVVDDNSTDGTSQKVHRVIKTSHNIRLIVNNPRMNLAPSIQKGIDNSMADLVLWMDADFSHPPNLIPVMLREIEKVDIVLGSWLVKDGKDERKEIVVKTFSRLINCLCQICFGKNIHAYTSGFVLAKKSLFPNFKLSGDYGEYCIDFLVKQQRMGRKIAEIPFACVSRQRGKSKTTQNPISFVKKGVGYLLMIFKLYITI